MPSAQFVDKIALITGASRGIGAAVAKGLAASGAHVILIARGADDLEVIDDEIVALGGTATLLPMDLLKLNDVDKIGPTIAERFGKLDILVGNAGMLGALSPVTHIRPKEWEKVMSLNFFSQVRLLRSVEPLLRQSEAGRIVFTSAHLPEKCPAYWAACTSSKAALNSFIKTYAAENAKTNMCVNGLAPGPVDTKFLRTAFPGKPKFAMKLPEDVVPAYLELLAEDSAINGEIVKLD